MSMRFLVWLQIRWSEIDGGMNMLDKRSPCASCWVDSGALEEHMVLDARRRSYAEPSHVQNQPNSILFTCCLDSPIFPIPSQLCYARVLTLLVVFDAR